MTTPYNPQADWEAEDNAKAYRIGHNPLTGELDPNWFTPVKVKGTGIAEDGTPWIDYITTGRTGFGGRAAAEQFIPAAAVKRITVDGRRRLAWR